MENTETQTNGTKGRTFRGVIVKSAMKDTVTVSVVRYVKHPRYKKYIRRSKKYLVHAPGNASKVGDTVVISETRPISKRKHFILAETIASKAQEQ